MDYRFAAVKAKYRNGMRSMSDFEVATANLHDEFLKASADVQPPEPAIEPPITTPYRRRAEEIAMKMPTMDTPVSLARASGMAAQKVLLDSCLADDSCFCFWSNVFGFR